MSTQPLRRCAHHSPDDQRRNGTGIRSGRCTVLTRRLDGSLRVELPHEPQGGFLAGARIWLSIQHREIVLTRTPQGPRGHRRYSRRVQQKSLPPLRLPPGSSTPCGQTLSARHSQRSHRLIQGDDQAGPGPATDRFTPSINVSASSAD